VILIDTGPLVALCDPRDRLHAAATSQLEALAGRDLRTCEPVLVETCFHLPHAAQRRRLRAIIETFEIRSAPQPPEEGFWTDVFEWLAKYGDHDPDWADGCLAVLSGLDRSAKVWTYDREFRTIWRQPDGSAIPMAVKAR
jgi:predicted nucleic acid-binding protein